MAAILSYATKNSRCDVFLEAAMHIVQSGPWFVMGSVWNCRLYIVWLVLSGWIVPIIFLKREAIRVQKPKIAVVEVGNCIDGMEYSEEAIYRNIPRMHWSKIF